LPDYPTPPAGGVALRAFAPLLRSASMTIETGGAAGIRVSCDRGE